MIIERVETQVFKLREDQVILDSQLRELATSLREKVSSLRDGHISLEAKLKEIATTFREELGLQEAVLVAAESSINTLKEALSHEADARATADKELLQTIEGWRCKEAQRALERERSERQLEDRAIRALCAEAADVWSLGRAEVDSHVMDLRRDHEQEIRRLWDAIDTHTHDVNVNMIDAEERKVLREIKDVPKVSPATSVTTTETRVMALEAPQGISGISSPTMGQGFPVAAVEKTMIVPMVRQQVQPVQPVTIMGPTRRSVSPLPMASSSNTVVVTRQTRQVSSNASTAVAPAGEASLLASVEDDSWHRGSSPMRGTPRSVPFPC
jgi:hypothetical protein